MKKTVCEAWKVMSHEEFDTLCQVTSVARIYMMNCYYDAIIIELKVNHSAEETIQQIKDRQYALRVEGKTGEKPEYTGRILAVGITYNKDDTSKKHECRVEILHGRL